MMFRFAGCCQPVPGEDIVGFITRGRGVTIHHADCHVAIDLANRHPERKIGVSWDADKESWFVVQLDLVTEDRRGLLRDVTEAIATLNTNVRAAEVSTSDDGTAMGHFVIEVSNLSHLNRIIDRVKKVKGVLSVKRARKRDAPDQSADV
jgi:GTP pyrophosphokinase